MPPDELAEAMQPAHTTGVSPPMADPSTEHLQITEQTDATHPAVNAPPNSMPTLMPLPESWPQQRPEHMELQTFTSVVAAAAAAGAMAAIHKLPSSQAWAQNGTPEQNAAFMAAANAAAAAAASQAAALATKAEPRVAAIQAPQQRLEESPASRQPPAEAANPGRGAQAPAQNPIQPGATGAGPRQAASDTSAHQPPQAPNQYPPDGHNRAGASGRDTTVNEASPFEQALIKRLQLYAWLVCAPLSSHYPACKLSILQCFVFLDLCLQAA